MILLLLAFSSPTDAQKESLRSRLQRHLKVSMQEMEDRLREPQPLEGALENSSLPLPPSRALTFAKEPSESGMKIAWGLKKFACWWASRYGYILIPPNTHIQVYIHLKQTGQMSHCSR